MSVYIHGVEYIPKEDAANLTVDRLKGAIEEITNIIYFDEKHKAKGLAWNALNYLSPELAKIATDNAGEAHAIAHVMDGK